MAFNGARFLWALVGYFLSFVMAFDALGTEQEPSLYTLFINGSIFALMLMAGHYLVTHK
ncbi:MAG: hypothetical protein ACC612_13085 [Methanomethylovorans sp.]|uniref:hypothetical protein n=1 Tax=Methanomethylovorans sp. TaxID=2758717 RepID=UPI003530F11B